MLYSTAFSVHFCNSSVVADIPMKSFASIRSGAVGGAKGNGLTDPSGPRTWSDKRGVDAEKKIKSAGKGRGKMKYRVEKADRDVIVEQANKACRYWKWGGMGLLWSGFFILSSFGSNQPLFGIVSCSVPHIEARGRLDFNVCSPFERLLGNVYHHTVVYLSTIHLLLRKTSQK